MPGLSEETVYIQHI